MQDPTPLDPPEQELEEALGSLVPSPTGISGEALWYRAKLTTERHRANRWRIAAAIATLAAGAAVAWRPKPATVNVDRVVVVREQEKPAVAPAPPPPVADRPDPGRDESDEVASVAYLRLRDLVARNGPDSLPATVSGDGNEALAPRAGSMSGWSTVSEFAPRSRHTLTRGG
jgi:hypothetical protein